jgi:hypothetical protein
MRRAFTPRHCSLQSSWRRSAGSCPGQPDFSREVAADGRSRCTRSPDCGGPAATAARDSYRQSMLLSGLKKSSGSDGGKLLVGDPGSLYEASLRTVSRACMFATSWLSLATTARHGQLRVIAAEPHRPREGTMAKGMGASVRGSPKRSGVLPNLMVRSWVHRNAEPSAVSPRTPVRTVNEPDELCPAVPG